MSCFILFSAIPLLFIFAKGQIAENHVGDYIIVHDPDASRDWFSAEDYCETNFGTKLASLHSQDDYDAIENGLVVTSGVCTWIGLNDINNEAGSDGTISATWEYTDGTNYDWELPWYPGEPSPNAGGRDNDCVYLLGTSGFIDVWCDGLVANTVHSCFSQWVCNGM